MPDVANAPETHIAGTIWAQRNGVNPSVETNALLFTNDEGFLQSQLFCNFDTQLATTATDGMRSPASIGMG